MNVVVEARALLRAASSATAEIVAVTAIATLPITSVIVAAVIALGG